MDGPRSLVGEGETHGYLYIYTLWLYIYTMVIYIYYGYIYTMVIYYGYTDLYIFEIFHVVFMSQNQAEMAQIPQFNGGLSNYAPKFEDSS